jgi:hypothetical protein
MLTHAALSPTPGRSRRGRSQPAGQERWSAHCRCSTCSA